MYVIKHDQTSTEMYFFLKFVEGILYYKQFKKFKMAAILSIWPKTENLNYEHISVTHVYNYFWGWETHWSHYFYSMMVPCDCNSIFHLPAFVLVLKMVMTDSLFLMGSIFNSAQPFFIVFFSFVCIFVLLINCEKTVKVTKRIIILFITIKESVRVKRTP